MTKGRVLLAMLGTDQHELGAVAIAGLLRDAGFEVVYVGRFQTPSTILRSAVDEDVDVIGISCHSWEFLDYLPELMPLLAERQVDAPVVLGGSIITGEDAKAMTALGVAAVFGSGSASAAIIDSISALATDRRARAGTA
ncbi:MAG: cobalamin-dependent protein [Rhodospirillales bacterium]|nr:cobalamin-dependent protein [Rhodospirillales bacterium]